MTFKNLLRRVALVVSMTAGAIAAQAAEGWGLVNMSVACVRERPSHSAELGSQVMMGTPVRILSEASGWCSVETPDGYRGYIIAHSLTPMDEAEMVQWRKSSRVMVVTPDEVVARDPSTGDAVTDLVAGCLVQALWSGDSVRVTTPDGRGATIPVSYVMTAEEWAAQAVDTGRVLDFARALTGRPYLWGGSSTKAMDCSGLTSLCYYVCAGVILPRNASQQAKVGEKIPVADTSAYREGDLIMFGNARTGKVTHVALCDGHDGYVHSSGRVKRNSLSKEDADYLDLTRLHVRRINQETLGGDGTVSVAGHPWYFD